jgi:hypothetical protein
VPKVNFHELFAQVFGKKEPVITPLSEGKIKLEIVCVCCKKTQFLVVREDQYNKFAKDDEYIQKAFPTLSADDRELILSHMCKECFDESTKDSDGGETSLTEGTEDN